VIPDEWPAIIARCDLVAVRNEIQEFVRIANEDAASRGETAVFRQDVADAVHAFLRAPTPTLALHLVETVPPLRQYFLNNAQR
jgi:hypothetical protein